MKMSCITLRFVN